MNRLVLSLLLYTYRCSTPPHLIHKLLCSTLSIYFEVYLEDVPNAIKILQGHTSCNLSIPKRHFNLHN